MLFFYDCPLIISPLYEHTFAHIFLSRTFLPKHKRDNGIFCVYFSVTVLLFPHHVNTPFHTSFSRALFSQNMSGIMRSSVFFFFSMTVLLFPHHVNTLFHTSFSRALFSQNISGIMGSSVLYFSVTVLLFPHFNNSLLPLMAWLRLVGSLKL